MAFWKETYLNKLREYVRNSIAKVQYKTSDIWENATINQIVVIGTQIQMFVNIPNAGSAQTITGIRIYDVSGEISGEQDCNISQTESQNLLIKFEFPLTEV